MNMFLLSLCLHIYIYIYAVRVDDSQSNFNTMEIEDLGIGIKMIIFPVFLVMLLVGDLNCILANGEGEENYVKDGYIENEGTTTTNISFPKFPF